MQTRALRIDVDAAGPVSGCLVRPEAARCLLVFAHGAGAGMHHPFMESVASALADRDIATIRYQFPYTEAGRRRPDPRPMLLATVAAAIREASVIGNGLELFAGGKSMGGRMTSLAASTGGLSAVRGLVFIGFPLHPAGAPSATRASHLVDVPHPMLFLQGTRDRLADLGLMRPVCREIGKRARLHVIDDADHGFHVRKRSGRTDVDVLSELADTTRGWIESVLDTPGPTSSATLSP